MKKLDRDSLPYRDCVGIAVFNDKGAVLIGRLLPVIRSFIAFPAGVARMRLVPFHIYTFIGSWPRCSVLAYIGMKLGAQFTTNPHFKEVFPRFHLGVEAVIVVGFIWFVVSHWKNRIRTESI